jgi:GH15 family glucan-1,4-alpha-glucosidase
MTYRPIDSYAIIGDMRSAALVNRNGSIDWLCVPRFDSPSVFAAILDDKKGGFFQIAPADDDGIGGKQFYWPDTNVLVTRFLQSGAAAELIDFMPVGEDSMFATARRQVIRRITVARGRLDLRMRCKPAFNYARDRHQVVLVDHGAEFHSANAHLGLASSVPLRVEDDAVVAEFSL